MYDIYDHYSLAELSDRGRVDGVEFKQETACDVVADAPQVAKYTTIGVPHCYTGRTT